jgi:hypothetical protein
MKKFFASFLVLTLLLGTTGISYAKNEPSYQNEIKYATLFLKNSGFGVNQLSNPITLKNVNGDEESVVFSLNENGYIIINLNNYDIPEFSFEASNPYTIKDAGNVYNGPFNYLRDDGENFTDIISKKIIQKSKVEVNYIQPLVDKAKKLQEIESASSSNSSENPLSSYDFIESGSISGTLRTWDTANFCGVDGTAILLQYYDDYWSEGFVPDDKETASALTDYLIYYNYIINDGASGPDIVNGYWWTTGLNDYLDDIGILSWNATTASYSWSTLKNQINMGRPLMVGANEEHPDFDKAHWIIAHGYFRGYDGLPYIVCNNGHGSNNVYLTAADQYYSWGFVYLY